MTESADRRRIVVGVTGAPGSGKSAAAACLRRLGAKVLCLDAIGHELLKDAPVREEIRRTFSTGVFRIMDGEVSREKLGALVFSDADELRKLNRILHPPMVERVREDVAAWREDPHAAPALVVEGALLIEMDVADICDHVVVVRAPRETRLARLARARGWKEDDLARRERAQLDDDARAARAGAVVENGSALGDLDEKLRALWEEWT
jgi:dephospho-CoA kinase